MKSITETPIKKIFLEFYDIKHYIKQASEQFVVKRYAIDNQKAIIDKEKSNE